MLLITKKAVGATSWSPAVRSEKVRERGSNVCGGEEGNVTNNRIYRQVTGIWSEDMRHADNEKKDKRNIGRNENIKSGKYKKI